MNKILAVLFLLFLMFVLMIGMYGIGLYCMIYGWGLTPKSWPVILGSYAATLFSALCVSSLQSLVKSVIK